jgi:hypothetical protein
MAKSTESRRDGGESNRLRFGYEPGTGDRDHPVRRDALTLTGGCKRRTSVTSRFAVRCRATERSRAAAPPRTRGRPPGSPRDADGSDHADALDRDEEPPRMRVPFRIQTAVDIEIGSPSVSAYEAGYARMHPLLRRNS